MSERVGRRRFPTRRASPPRSRTHPTRRARRVPPESTPRRRPPSRRRRVSSILTANSSDPNPSTSSKKTSRRLATTSLAAAEWITQRQLGVKTIDQRVVDDAPRETSVGNDAHDAAIEPDAYAFEMVDAEGGASAGGTPRARSIIGPASLCVPRYARTSCNNFPCPRRALVSLLAPATTPRRPRAARRRPHRRILVDAWGVARDPSAAAPSRIKSPETIAARLHLRVEDRSSTIHRRIARVVVVPRVTESHLHAPRRTRRASRIVSASSLSNPGVEITVGGYRARTSRRERRSSRDRTRAILAVASSRPRRRGARAASRVPSRRRGTRAAASLGRIATKRDRRRARAPVESSNVTRTSASRGAPERARRASRSDGNARALFS